MTNLSFSLHGRVGDLPFSADYDGPADGVTAIWGSSGSGKTTLLRAMAGLIRLTGHVRLDGTAWQDAKTFVPPHNRQVGLVFQEASLFPHLSVTGNLDYARKRSARPDDSVIDLLGVRPLMSRAVDKLSGGERQRVALARTLLSAPRLLLMDEPLSSLDHEAKADILPLIREISRRLPVIYVSHDIAEVAALADRTLRMESGVLRPAVTPAQNLDGLSEAQIRALAEAALKAGLTA